MQLETIELFNYSPFIYSGSKYIPWHCNNQVPSSTSTIVDNATHIFGLSPLVVAIISVIITVTLLLTYHWCNDKDLVPRHSHPSRFVTNLDWDTLTSIDFYNITNAFVRVLQGHCYGLKTRDKTCAMCLCEFLDGELVRVLPECLHPIHVSCIDMWLIFHTNCPICHTDATPGRPTFAHQPESDALPNIKSVWLSKPLFGLLGCGSDSIFLLIFF